MRRSGSALAISSAAVVLAGCFVPSGPSGASTSPTPDQGGGSTTPTGVLAVFLGPVPSNARQFQVSLVQLDGSVLAKTQAKLRTNAAGTPLPFLSASSSRAYFLDGDTQLKSLSPDGKVAAVRDIAGNDHIRSAFAVSPDDRRIAISTIDYSQVPPFLRLSVEDLKGGNRTEIFSSGSLYVWPVAWHQGKLVVAVGDAYPTGPPPQGSAHPWCLPVFGACVADNPYAATHGYHVVDPTDATRLASLGSDQCEMEGLLTNAGTMCRQSRFKGGTITPTHDCRPELTICQRLVDWSGSITDWTTIATIWIGIINPSATQMAGCCNGDSLALYAARTAGGDEKRLGKSAPPVWWMDDNHILYQPFGAAMHILTLDIGPDVVVKAPGFPVASIPVAFQ
jgi:hypothetical protein